MQNCQDNQNSDAFMNINHVDPTKDASVGTGSGKSIGRLPPTPANHHVCSWRSCGWTDRDQAWGDGIPEPEATWQEVGRGGGQTASTLGFSLLFPHLTGIRAQSWLAP